MSRTAAANRARRASEGLAHDGRESRTPPEGNGSLALRARTESGPAHADNVPEPPCFALAALLGDLRQHPELDLDTLAYHLRESDATAADGYCHAAINEARSFLEALLVSIVHAVRRDAALRDSDSALRDRSQNGTAFRTYRRYLLEAGFIDADENELLQYVYSVASAKGSHHGVTDEAWTRLARRMVFTTGQYVMQRYAAWRHNGRPTAPPERQPASPRRRWLPRAIRGLIRSRVGCVR